MPTVLLVDDEPHITHMVALKLRGAGISVLCAADGEEALDLAIAHRPDLIITDLQMPYMSGVELCQQLGRLQATRRIPVILLTARGYVLDQSQRGQERIACLMPKPFSARQILAKTFELIGTGTAEESAPRRIPDAA